MENEIAKGLIERYANDSCTAEEKAIVESWFLDAILKADDTDMDAPDFNKASAVLSKALPLHRRKRFNYKHLAAAAAILIFIFTAGWFISSKDNNMKTNPMLAGQDVGPGKNIAVLTLANGKTIELSDAKTGVVIDKKGVTYNDGSAIQSSINGTPSHGAALLKASTPRGGTYQITLSDGTKVWLNSASSLQFPGTFKGLKERRVELIGEAYFEVSKVADNNGKNRRLPFIVESNGQEVEVLGTHFNINSYPDEEQIRTTLLEGSVKVSTGARTSGENIQQLNPGQQSRISRISPGKVVVVPANIKQVMAWKNGYFHFENDNLPTVMRQLSRWYDIDVIYQVDRMDDEFFGDFDRNKKLSDALKVLEFGGEVHFKIENRKLIVTK